ncbi:dienelactone hydrolase family protein [Microbulbifer hydrolyticus]|uniref:Dienelactone hydrolase n=1 Tax=Microbulbifer hydrolyticus TaxID=48074 RepID=A0AA89PDL2_9GAMM|nr:prolyl oligopeptidase family serine peptidase [Microbulbifer hydrolyticus]MBB5212090.1 dienelactone hydrolase [Microbulbifer hydrolyticus]
MDKREVVVDAAGERLEGFLTLPPHTRSLVLFAHGSGSSRFSPRNNAVAAELNDAGIGTLLFDLLTAAEHRVDEVTREYRFDIERLARRLAAAVDWAADYPDTAALNLGLFGSSTGAAAALIAAAARPQCVKAVVSRGGRPDLAGAALPLVQAPTLLLVGGEDIQVIELNRQAAAQMEHLQRTGPGPQLEIVPGATHLFEEPGTLAQVVRLAIDWFQEYLGDAPSQAV